jgi:PEP-CTERM motif
MLPKAIYWFDSNQHRRKYWRVFGGVDMKSKFLGLVLIIAVTSAATAQPAEAAVTLDNSPPSGSISSFGNPDSMTYGQTFTAPVTGTLTSFTLWLNGGVGELYGGVGTWNGSSTFGLGFGSPTNLYQSANVASLGPGPYTFAPNINVVAGENYVAYLSVFGVANANAITSMPQSNNPVEDINYFVWHNSGPSFGGNPDPRNNASWNYFSNLGDAQFSATFVAAAGVPEPSTWAMMLIGFAGLGLAVQRKARARQFATASA